MREQTTWSEKTLNYIIFSPKPSNLKFHFEIQKRRESISTKKQIKHQFITRKENELFQSKKESQSNFG